MEQHAHVGSPLNHAATARKPSTDSPHHRYSDPLKKVSQTSGGSDHSVEHSPLHRNHVKSSWEKKGSTEGTHGVAPNTPGRFKTRTGGGRGDESPEKSTVVPTFGEWDESDPASADGFTDVFNQVRDERQSGSAKVPQITDDSIYWNSYGQPSRDKSSSCLCFNWCRK